MPRNIIANAYTATSCSVIALRLALAALTTVSALGLASGPLLAQSAPPAATAPAAPSQAPLKAEEVEALVAPIALYPDDLLSEVLMASTYPLEVVEADRWVKKNKALKGQALTDAVDKQQWDASIKSLTAVPDVLAMMSTQLDWTQKLGDTVLAQQADVMDAVQRLRQRAQANNKLQTTKEQKVTVTQNAGKQYIAIEPAVENTVYVPYYDPAVVYGAWGYPAYPPYYFTPPGYIAGAAIATGVAFATGVAIGAWAANHGWWGGGIGWHNNIINVRNTDINVNNINRNTWVHNPDHRHGVRYGNADVRQKFAPGEVANRDRRMDFRGHDGNQVLRPDGDRAGLNRPDAKGRDGDRPGAKGAGERAKAAGKAGAGKQTAAKGGDRPRPNAQRPSAQRPSGQRPNVQRPGGHDGALAHIDRGAFEHAGAARGHASLGGGGGPRAGGFAGGGGMRGGGGGLRGGGGGGGFHGRR
jgi:uncharacterized membrane protein YgcG